MAKALRAARVAACVAACVWMIAGACGSDGSFDLCRDGPTYATDVRPLNEAFCVGCHSERLAGLARQGAPASLNYDSFELIEPHRAAYANAFTSGTMPPADSGLIVRRAERDVVSSWRRCGFSP